MPGLSAVELEISKPDCAGPNHEKRYEKKISKNLRKKTLTPTFREMKLKPVKAKCLLEQTIFELSPAHVFYQVISDFREQPKNQPSDPSYNIEEHCRYHHIYQTV